MQPSQQGGPSGLPPAREPRGRLTSAVLWLLTALAGLAVAGAGAYWGLAGLRSVAVGRLPGRSPGAASPLPASPIVVGRIPIACSAVVGDGRRGLLYLAGRRDLIATDLSGSVLARARLSRCVASPPECPVPYTTLRLLNVDGDPEPEILGFGHWGQSVDVFDSDGRPCWQYGTPSGVNDAWSADLDGDGLDEVVVGLNGGSGMPVLGHDGRVLWTDPDLGNVWSVCMADTDRDGATEVVCSPHEVRAYTAAGRRLSSTRAAGFSLFVRPAGPPGGGVTLVAGLPQLHGLGVRNRHLWALETGIPKATVSAVAEGQPWLALTGGGGTLVLVDAAQGRVMARETIAGLITGLSWYEDGAGPPLLLVATGQGVLLCRVPRAAPAGPTAP